jgi:hypothetical protein
MGEKTNKRPYQVIEPGEPVVLLTYMVGLCPDGNIEQEYEPIPVHLRFRPDEIKGDRANPDEELRKEILKRAEKLERREHSTLESTTFTLGTVRLTRQKLDVAR